MRFTFALVLPLALMACSKGADTTSNQAMPEDFNDTSISNISPEGEPQSSNASNIATSSSPLEMPGNTDPRPTRSIPEPRVASMGHVPPIGPPGAQDAVEVLNNYYGMIGSHDYSGAYGLWEKNGRASGLSKDDFAQKYDTYSSYSAKVGVPNRIEPAAGDRHVVVPVTVDAQVKGGSKVKMSGSATLHRAADADSMVPGQKSWQIESIQVSPKPTT